MFHCFSNKQTHTHTHTNTLLLHPFWNLQVWNYCIFTKDQFHHVLQAVPQGSFSTEKSEGISWWLLCIFTLQWLFCYLEYIFRWMLFSIILFLLVSFYLKMRSKSLMNMKLVQVKDNWTQRVTSNAVTILIFPDQKQNISTKIATSSHKQIMQQLTLLNKYRKLEDEINYLELRS